MSLEQNGHDKRPISKKKREMHPISKNILDLSIKMENVACTKYRISNVWRTLNR